MADHIPRMLGSSDSDDDIVQPDAAPPGDTIRSEEVSCALFGCAMKSINFMIWVGLAMFPLTCPHGCSWRVTFPTSRSGGDPARRKGRVNSCFLSCKNIRRQVADGNGNMVWKSTACPAGKPSWRSNEFSFASELSSSIGPQKLARLILPSR